MSGSSEYLLERLTGVARLEDADDRWATEDLLDLTLEVAEFVRDRLDVPALELELIARSQLDTSSIAWLIRALGAIAADNAGAFQLEIGLGTGVFIDWKSRLSRLDLVAGGLESPQELDQLEVSLRLGLGADGAIDTLLAALPNAHPLKAQIESRLLAKLALWRTTRTWSSGPTWDSRLIPRARSILRSNGQLRRRNSLTLATSLTFAGASRGT